MTRPVLGGRPVQYPEPWRQMAESAGGVNALAEAFGMDVSTLWKWANGKHVPNAVTRRAVNAWATRRGIAAPFSG